MGFDNSDDSDVESGNLTYNKKETNCSTQDVLFENNLLDGLPSWLERLFEGTTHRYHIQYWPDNMK
jgi:hypothetical protein